ncbi:MAG: tetratricopeptide repeat protein [bacterium]|nr:tetratricopeptide repeat protein [bacterium]
MWYLIIPPIIVVVSLSFVLWYLSRKGADPLIAEKVSQSVEEAQEQISFLRTKNFFLRILEKVAYRFKVVSLQMHNGLHDLTQALKARRRRFQDGLLAKKSKESLEQPKVSAGEQAASHTGFLRRFAQRSGKGIEAGERERLAPASPESFSSQAVLGKPISHQSKPEEAFEENRPIQVSHEPASPPLPTFLRPMVSETITRPETGRERTQADIAREENLIARIAVNPKDFTAYEGLGDYYLEVGNIKDAKECYRQVLKLSPLHRIVRIKIRRLEKLLGQ